VIHLAHRADSGHREAQMLKHQLLGLAHRGIFRENQNMFAYGSDQADSVG